MKKLTIYILCISIVLSSLCINAFAFSATNGNIAIGKPTSHSSTYMGYEGAQGAHNAVDGDLNTEFASHRDAAGSWFIVDLKKPYPLSKIRLAGRWRMEEPEGLKNFEVQLSNDANFSSYEVVHRQGGDSFGYQKWLDIPITSQTAYQYVRYIGTVACVRSIAEIEIYDSNLEMDSPFKAYDNKDYAKALKILEYLNIFDLDSFDEERPVTRAEIISQLVRLAGYSKPFDFSNEQVFVDVEPSHKYFNDINTAYQLGWLSKPDDGRFCPSEFVSRTAFLKMLLFSIGYGDFIEMRGGWPIGVEKTVRDLKILDGAEVYEDRVLLQNEMIVMMYNALKAPYLSEGITNNYFTYSKSSNILAFKHNIVEINGILNANSYTAFDGTNGVNDGYVEVANTLYRDATESADGFFGYNVDCLVDTKANAIVVCAKSSKNKENVLMGADITSNKASFNANLINYWDANAKERTIRLEKGYVVVHSGVVYDDYTFDNFTGENVRITAVDTNSNSYIDVLFVEDFESFVVKSAFYDDSSAKGSIIGENGKTYSFEDIENNPLKILIDGGSVNKVNSLENGDVVSVTQHPLKRSLLVYPAVDKFISGRLESYSASSKLLGVNGTNYKINQGYFDGLSKQSEYAAPLKAGEEYTFGLNITGEVVSVKKGLSADTDYMFVLKVAPQSLKGLGTELKIRVYKRDATFATYSFAEKFTVDRIRYTSAGIVEKFKPDENGNPSNYKVTELIPEDIAIVTVKNNLVTEIDTINVNYAAGETIENSLDKTTYNKDLQWNYYHNNLYSDYNHTMELNHGNNSPVFAIPYAKNEMGVDQVSLTTTKLYNVYAHPGSTNGYTNEHGTGIVAAYDVDRATKYCDIYLKKVDASQTGNPAMGEEGDFMLVSEVLHSLDEDGEAAVFVDGYANGNPKSFYIKGETLSNIEDGPQIKKGDIIRVKINSLTGYAENFVYVFRPDVNMTEFGGNKDGDNDPTNDINIRDYNPTNDTLWYVGNYLNSFRSTSRANFAVVTAVKDGYFAVCNVLPDVWDEDTVFKRTDSYKTTMFRYFTYSAKHNAVEEVTASYLNNVVYETNPKARVMVMNGRNQNNELVVIYLNDK